MGITNLELPFPPSLNHYWRSVVMGRSARVLISAAGRKYREAVTGHVLAARANRMLTGRLSVRVDLSPPDRRKRDLDNYAKGLLDALTHAGVWADDEQIDRLVLARGAVCKGGRAVVAIEGYEHG